MDYMERYSTASSEYLASPHADEMVTDSQVAIHGTFACVRIASHLTKKKEREREPVLSTLPLPPGQTEGPDPVDMLPQQQQSQYAPLDSSRLTSLADGRCPEPTSAPSKAVPTRKLKRTKSDAGREYWASVLAKHPDYMGPVDVKKGTWDIEYLIPGLHEVFAKRPRGRNGCRRISQWTVKWMGWPEQYNSVVQEKELE
jgi:hypothetical protein